MAEISKIVGHLKTVLTHKKWVLYYAVKAGIPIQGLFHDMSKFSWTEFSESVKYYKGTSSPINACKADIGYSLAWQHHKGRNPHHYEYWIDQLDKGGVPIEMPYKYVVEMLCDYLAAGKAYNGKNFTFVDEYEWWTSKISSTPPKMHPATKLFMTTILSEMASDEELHENPLSRLNSFFLHFVYGYAHKKSAEEV